jgi:hypothetical protein
MVFSGPKLAFLSGLTGPQVSRFATTPLSKTGVEIDLEFFETELTRQLGEQHRGSNALLVTSRPARPLVYDSQENRCGTYAAAGVRGASFERASRFESVEAELVRGFRSSTMHYAEIASRRGPLPPTAFRCSAWCKVWNTASKSP